MYRAATLAPLLLSHALAAGTALAQTSPTFGPLSAASNQGGPDDMLLADYLGLLKQIAPAAEGGARAYLAAMQLRCGRLPTTAELRQAVSEGEGNPTLIGLIRAAHQNDTASRDRLVAQLRCPGGGSR